MFGKILVGVVAILVIGVGAYLYIDSSNTPDYIPGSCPSSNQPSACASEEPSCCSIPASRISACCESELGACEELTVAPREMK
jgi:hypothetical protein